MQRTAEIAGYKRGRMIPGLAQFVRTHLPSGMQAIVAAISAFLLILAFPDAGLWPLAWVALVPLLVLLSREIDPVRAFFVSWLFAGLFFYGSCYWLTYAMIRYGSIPAPIAYLLLTIPSIIVGAVPALFLALLSAVVSKYGPRAVLLAPLFWTASEWARLGVTGQLWNAIGYSQAYALSGYGFPVLIQSARWGGVYLVGLLIVAINAAIAYVWLERRWRSLVEAFAIAAAVMLVIFVAAGGTKVQSVSADLPFLDVVAVQPNVPMVAASSLQEAADLLDRHRLLSEQGLSQMKNNGGDERLVIWPESPMNFQWANDTEMRDYISAFAQRNQTNLILNALEPAPGNGAYNSALLINPAGHLVRQYDKIRLLPFGEYVPVPRWIPGAGLVPAMVGDFTPGADYPLLPVGDINAAAFICFESAFPSISRNFSERGADILINISNDGYLGPTPVLKQHLANAVFRAVENRLTVVRVTNTGITALINGTGTVQDATPAFTETVRVWRVYAAPHTQTLYTRFGDIIPGVCLAISLGLLLLALRRRFRTSPAN
jgi:apolipoprotein N-acyltransferase